MSFDFDTGKYAFFVWTSYGATAVVVAWMIFDSFSRARKWRKESDRLQAQKDAAKAKP